MGRIIRRIRLRIGLAISNFALFIAEIAKIIGGLK